jgi:hypothetical protein
MTNARISKRATEAIEIQCPMNLANKLVREKLHHPEFNPNGALNLGLAHNDLLQEKVFEKVVFLPTLFALCLTHHYKLYQRANRVSKLFLM